MLPTPYAINSIRPSTYVHNRKIKKKRKEKEKQGEKKEKRKRNMGKEKRQAQCNFLETKGTLCWK